MLVASVVILLASIPLMIRQGRQRAWDAEARRVKNQLDAERIAKEFLAKVRPDLPDQFQGSRVNSSPPRFRGSFSFNINKDVSIRIQPRTGMVLGFMDFATAEAHAKLSPNNSLVPESAVIAEAQEFLNAQAGRVPPMRLQDVSFREGNVAGMKEWHLLWRREYSGIPFHDDIAFAEVDPVSGKVYLWSNHATAPDPTNTQPTVAQPAAELSARAILAQLPGSQSGAVWNTIQSPVNPWALASGLCYLTLASGSEEVISPRLGWLFWFETDRLQHPNDPPGGHPMQVELFVDGFSGDVEVLAVSQ